MTTYNTGNPVPSADARDRYDNSQTFDEVINGTLTYYVNRKGANVYSLAGMAAQFNSDQISRTNAFNAFLASSGYEIPVDYTPGLSITRPTQQVRYLGELYRPKDSSIPFTTTAFPADSTKWISNGDNALRQQLAGSSGAGLVGFQTNGITSFLRTVASKCQDFTSIKDWGAIGDGASHPLSERFSSLALAQMVYPHVIALTDEIDWAATQGALNHMKTKSIAGYIGGGLAYAPAGSYILNRKVLIPEKCGLNGESSTATRFKLGNGANIGTDGIFENESKLGIGQEWFFLSNLNVDGNKAQGTTAGACIKVYQIYVNSYLTNLLVGNSPGHSVWLLATPDGIAPGDGGPLHIENCWLRVPNGHCLFVDGDFSEVNTYGGAFENPAAGFDCIHIDGTPYGGVRANFCLHSPHFEYGNSGSKGIYCRRAVGTVTNLTSIGTQEATQYNVYVDTNCNFTMVGFKQGVGIRKGIYFVDSGREYTATYGGVISNDVTINDRAHTSSGTSGADITVDCGANDVLSMSAGATTSVANFANTAGPRLTMRFANANYTMRNNATIKLKPASDYAVPAGAIMEFFRIGTVWYESGRN